MPDRLYSTSNGTSCDKHNLTLPARPLALQKLTRYLSEKVRDTGSERLIVTSLSGLSTLVCERKVTDPLPMSPWQEKRTPSLVASMPTVNTSVFDLFLYSRT